MAAAEHGEASASRRADGTLVIHLGGVWHVRGARPSPEQLEGELNGRPPPGRVAFDAAALGGWDSTLVAFLVRVIEACGRRGVSVDREGLPSGVKRLLALSDAVPERHVIGPHGVAAPVLARIGVFAIRAEGSFTAILAVVGEIARAIGRLAHDRPRFRPVDLMLLIQQAGADALPIVTLVSFLVGAIFAFVGAVQLERFGAGVYVADLVGVAMVRDMGAVMTGIVLAGRTGAAYAAQLGTMKVTQEIDALVTMGLSPVDFLVLPRIIALAAMVPLLCLYADVVGVAGGGAVAVGMLHMAPATFLGRIHTAVDPDMLWGGVFKAAVYGVLVAFSGCFRGLQGGGNASAVGDAATHAVVTSIVLIISACGVFAVSFYLIGI
jgi:phospholipid/cholesterol/gamma-HCH transport system permease protein